jgi:hypothetical protein
MDWSVTVRLWVIEQNKAKLLVPGTKDYQVRELLALHGCVTLLVAKNDLSFASNPSERAT